MFEKQGEKLKTSKGQKVAILEKKNKKNENEKISEVFKLKEKKKISKNNENNIKISKRKKK